MSRKNTLNVNDIILKCMNKYWEKGINSFSFNSIIYYSGVSKPTMYRLVGDEVTLKDNSHITLKQNHANGRKIAVAYSMFNDIFDGHEAEFTIENGADISIEDIDMIIGDVYGNSIDIYFNEIDDNTGYEYEFNINSIYPNPFNPSTDISFTLPVEGYVKLSVYNIKGQEVDVIFEGYQDSGLHSYTWDASTFASGIYYFHLIEKNNVSTAKGIFVK